MFCRSNHYSDKCTIVTDVKGRKDILRNSNCCFNCFKSEHMSRNCSTAKKCFYCKANHNFVSCEKKNNNEQQNIDSHSSSLNETSRDETNLIVNSRTPVILQRAVIDVLAPNLG